LAGKNDARATVSDRSGLGITAMSVGNVKRISGQEWSMGVVFWIKMLLRGEYGIFRRHID
jgi:hypothetical protein